RLAERARAAEPGNFEARLEVARALVGRRDYTRAEQALKALRTEYPKVAAVRALYGAVLAARSDQAGAAREFDRAPEIDPANAAALAGRVATDLRAKRPEDARRRVARALEARPASAALRVVAARMELTLQQTKVAEDHLRAAIG